MSLGHHLSHSKVISIHRFLAEASQMASPNSTGQGSTGLRVPEGEDTKDLDNEHITQIWGMLCIRLGNRREWFHQVGGGGFLDIDMNKILDKNMDHHGEMTLNVH